MIETDESTTVYKEGHSHNNIYPSKEYPKEDTRKSQHPTIAEELRAAFETQIEPGNGPGDKEIRDLDTSSQSQLLSNLPENFNTSEKNGGLSTIEEHQNNTSIETEFDCNDLVDRNSPTSSKNVMARRSASFRHKSSTVSPNSSLLEVSESVSSQETIEVENLTMDFNKNGIKTKEKSANPSKNRNRKDLYKRMASDTDLWIAIKSRPSKFQSTLEATKEKFDKSFDKPSKYI